MPNTKEREAERGQTHYVAATHRRIAGVGTVSYILEQECGESRTVYGTPCEEFYTLTVRSAREECRLVDIAREREAALSLCLRFATLGVLPDGAEEAYEELCYT